MPTGYPAGAQSLLRSINERAVLELINAQGPITRTEVARQSGLSKPTVSLALAALVERQAVQEIGHVTGRKGPAAVLYQINPTLTWAIGIDLGHDRLRVAIADVTGTVRARADLPVVRTVAGLVDQVTEVCAEVCRQAGVELSAVAQLVIGVPAVVGPDGRALSYAEGLPDSGRGLGHALAAALPTTVVLENDVNLAALAERSRGHGAGVDDFVLLSLGVGLGLGVVIGGRLYRGASGAAGEAGYLPGDSRRQRVAGLGSAPAGDASPPAGDAPDPAAESTDRAGDASDPAGDASGRAAPPSPALVESHIGARHIVAGARARGLGRGVTPREVFELARSGDTVAAELVDDTARSIAYVIATVASLLDPSLVVLGGAIGSNGDLLLAPVNRHLTAYSPFRPRIVSSELGSDAVLLGATASAVELARSTAFTKLTGAAADSP